MEKTRCARLPHTLKPTDVVTVIQEVGGSMPTLHLKVVVGDPTGVAFMYPNIRPISDVQVGDLVLVERAPGEWHREVVTVDSYDYAQDERFSTLADLVFDLAKEYHTTPANVLMALGASVGEGDQR